MSLKDLGLNLISPVWEYTLFEKHEVIADIFYRSITLPSGELLEFKAIREDLHPRTWIVTASIGEHEIERCRRCSLEQIRTCADKWEEMYSTIETPLAPQDTSNQ
jgi:hypothetical protein